MTDQPTTEGTAAPAAETPTTPAQSDKSVVAEIMAFDPFGPATPAKAEPEATTGDKPAEGEADEVEQEAQPQGQPQPAPAQPMQQGPTPREQELQAQVAALQRAIQEGATPKSEAKPTTKEPKYNLGLPPQLIQGLRSEDEQEFATSMHAVINGITNRIWTDVMEHLDKQVLPTIDQRASMVVSQGQTMRQVHDEFYGAYPHLKNPMLQPLVQNAALAVARQWAGEGKAIEWNKDFMEAVGVLVSQVVPNPAAQQTPKPKPKAPTFTAGQGTRPAAPAGNEFAEVL